MEKRCESCGKNLLDSSLTHCSDKCLFQIVEDSTSISQTPMESWFEATTEPWT